MKNDLFRSQGKFLILISFFFIGACSDNGPNYDKDLQDLMSDLDLTDTVYPQISVSSFLSGCSEITEDFCDKLYESDRKGNVDIVAGEQILKIRLGKNSKGFERGESNFNLAKWTAQRQLPEPFLGLLKSQNYFELLKKYLKTKAFEDSTPEEEVEARLLSGETKIIWAWALNETIEQEVSKAFSQNMIPENRLERRLERSRISKKLKAEIYNIIWRASPFWRQAETEFDQVKQAFVEVLSDQNLNLDSSLREKWIETVREVKMIPPGSDPENLQEACATESMNAKYFPTDHYFIICAGYFGSTELSGIIAHEISHSLGIFRNINEYKKQSTYASKMKRLRDQICYSNHTKACPDAWADFKDHSSELLDMLSSNWKPPVKNLLACLQYSDDLKEWPPTKEEIKSLAGMQANQIVGYLAEENEFLKMIKANLKNADGTESRNPEFFNPCNSSDWSESDYRVGSVWDPLFFFSASYMCGDSSKSADIRLDAAITEAKTVYKLVLEKEILLGGSFSKRDDLASLNYSEDSEERFADALGFRVLAQILKKEQLELRRAKYLSNISTFCEPPSTMKQYPAELQAEKKHGLDPHSAGLRRRLETLVPELREVLQCTKDFELKDCAF